MDLATLAEGIGDRADEILTRFVGWVEGRGLELYPAQEEAMLELLDGKHVILNTPTGSGKSLVAEALHFQSLAQNKLSYYTCPIKALVNEKFFALCEAFGAANVGMQTGDASINATAPIICCTAEVLANLMLRDSHARLADQVVIMDEFHYYADKERGVAWQIPLLLGERTQFLLMSATLGDTRVIEEGMLAVTGKPVAVVRSMQRPVPLEYIYKETPLHETIDDLVQRGRAPIYLVNFTQRAAAEEAQNLTSVNLCTKEEKAAIAEAIKDVKLDTPYAKELSRFIKAGIGLHHAGLLPKYRLLVERLAQEGLLKVISGTDTLGMGINIPLRTVLFTQLCKFDGEKSTILSVRDFHQIAGRAGRKGFDEEGFVVVQAPAHAIENLRLATKKAAGKKVVMQKPPQKGYVHWDRTTFERLLEKAPEPLESRFSVTLGMLVSLLQGDADGYRVLVQLIARAHASANQKRTHRKTGAVLFRVLRKAGILNVAVAQGRGRVEVSPELQRDFSLNHSLSMYVVDTLSRLDRASPDYALDVLTLVESILENPQVVLWAQLDQLKTAKMAALKAEGVEFAQRIEELDKMEYPKPLRDFIYETFNEFALRHPWLGSENIRPKSVARDLMERFCSFADYVRDYELQRSEGVLLRYLSQAYKALAQTVPEPARTDELEDLLEQLRAFLRNVDSSLLDEWTHLLAAPDGTVVVPRSAQGLDTPLAERAARELQQHTLAHDPRALAVRVRGDLHRLVTALGRRRWDDAALLLRAPGDDSLVQQQWTAQSLEAALAPYFAEHPAIDVTPRARRANLTRITPLDDAPHCFSAKQRILSPELDEEEADWALDAVVDLRRPLPPDQPIIELRSIVHG